MIPGPRSPSRDELLGGCTDEARDADLARRAPTDPAAFAAIYRRYGDRLFDFCVRMLRDPHAAADCVQDVFVTAATRLDQLREHDKLKAWLYAIARHEVMRRVRTRDRERLTDDLPDTAALGSEPDDVAARRELAELVAEATAGLSDRERLVFELYYRHELDGPALSDALGVSASNANTLVARLRATVEKSLAAVLVARHRIGACAELAAMLDGWDGRLSILMRKRIARHTERCAGCGQARRDLLDPRALLASSSMVIPAPNWLHEQAAAASSSSLGSTATSSEVGSVAGSSWWPAGLGGGFSALATPLGTAAIAAPLAASAIVASILVGALGADSGAEGMVSAEESGPATAAPSAPRPPFFTYDLPTSRYSSPRWEARTTEPEVTGTQTPRLGRQGDGTSGGARSSGVPESTRPQTAEHGDDEPGEQGSVPSRGRTGGPTGRPAVPPTDSTGPQDPGRSATTIPSTPATSQAPTSAERDSPVVPN